MRKPLPLPWRPRPRPMRRLRRRPPGNHLRHRPRPRLSRPASLPSPSFSNIVIEDGEATLEDMLAEIGDGLIVELLMGAGQGNVLSGEFSGNVLLGYAVRGGRIAGRVKDTMVYGNIYEALKDVLAVGRDVAVSAKE